MNMSITYLGSMDANGLEIVSAIDVVKLPLKKTASISMDLQKRVSRAQIKKLAHESYLSLHICLL